MNILSIVGIGLIAAILCILLRQYRPEFAMLASLAAGIFILFVVLDDVLPVVSRIGELLDQSSLTAEYAGVLLKALGICFITQIACDTCKDAGESAISAKIEMAGKLAVLIVSLPLFEQVLSIVYSLIN